MDTESIQFRYNRALLKVAAAVAALMVVFGIYLSCTEWPRGSDLAQGILIVVFSIGVLVWLTKVWSDRRIVVEIGADGIYDRRLSDQLIRWNAIVSIRGYGVWDNRWLKLFGTLGGVRGATNKFVGFVVESPESIYRPPNPFVRVFNRLVCWVLGYPLLSINMGPLDGTYDDLIDAIHHFAPGKGIEIRT